MKKGIKLCFFCTLMTFLMLGSWCFGGIAQASVQEDFINHLSPDIIKVAHQYNLYPSVMMAQAALESDFGQSSLFKDANNYFGVKGSYNGQSVYLPTMEYNQQGQPYYINSSFKKYPNAEASIEDNARLIRDGIYGNPTIYSGAWRENAADSVTAANALGGHYATDPNYANNLVNIIREYNLNSLLDNAWKKIHIVKLRKRARQILKKIRHYRKRYSHSYRGSRYDNAVDRRAANYQHKLVKYTKLYRNNQVTLDQNYHAYSIYDHLNRMDLDNWERLGARIGRSVYVDQMGTRNGHRYFRIRFSPSQRHMYWVRSKALKFVQPIYYYHPYRINAQQLDLSRAYNHILGTDPSLIKVVHSKFRRSSYPSNQFAVVPNNYSGSVWYRIRNNEGRKVWVSGNHRRPTQYLDYYETKRLSPNYRQAPLTNHAADPAYHLKNYLWSRVKPRNNEVQVSRLAIDTEQNNQFWYRFNNRHHTYWTNVDAF